MKYYKITQNFKIHCKIRNLSYKNVNQSITETVNAQYLNEIQKKIEITKINYKEIGGIA